MVAAIALGELHGRRPRMVDRLAPVVRLLDRLGADRGPDLDITRRAGADRAMLDRIAVAAEALAQMRPGKDPVDRRQDIVGRAERPGQAQPLERLAGSADPAGEGVAAFGERGWIGTLEGIDRLLLVADRKQRAPPLLARARPGEELVGQIA